LRLTGRLTVKETGLSSELKLVFSHDLIMDGITALADRIYHGPGGAEKASEPLTFIILLKGGARFACDLMTRYPGRYYYDFAGVSSYADNKSSRGTVDFYHFAPRHDLVDGRTVVLLDDICDSGLTFQSVAGRIMRDFKPEAVRTCALLCRGDSAFKPDFFAFQVDSGDFLVGYGLGLGEEHRDLNGIFALARE
jgi:hypoxanthine phosphoribosyltransferase